jgi:hypothetical protein
MDRCDNADEKIEPHSIARLQSNADGLAAHTSYACLAVGFVREGVVHVVRQLAVNADRLQTVQHGVS